MWHKTACVLCSCNCGVEVRLDGREITHTEVGLFLGKNPWHSHGIPEARRTLKAMAADPDRCLVVVDPRRTETAELADHHLQVEPGTDAYCVAALAAVIVADGLAAGRWLARNAVGVEPVLSALAQVPVAGGPWPRSSSRS